MKLTLCIIEHSLNICDHHTKWTYAKSSASYQHAHPRSLIKELQCQLKKATIAYVTGQRTAWLSNQTDLELHCPHMFKDPFIRDPLQFRYLSATIARMPFADDTTL